VRGFFSLTAFACNSFNAPSIAHQQPSRQLRFFFALQLPNLNRAKDNKKTCLLFS
jgi:hypothetical protein